MAPSRLSWMSANGAGFSAPQLLSSSALQLLICLLLLVSSAEAALDTSQLNRLRCQVWEEIARDDRRLPQLVRLTFHDCVGGCDGLLDLGNNENAGLADPKSYVDTLYTQEYSSLISKADMYALVGTMALLKGADNVNGNNWATTPLTSLVLATGRVDNTASTPPARVFPDAHGGASATMVTIKNTFGLTDDEAVALVGAHTLGKASPQNSGFDGPWVGPGQTALDNAYYRGLSEPGGWQQEDQNPNGQTSATNPSGASKWQYKRVGGGPGGGRAEDDMNLNADMALYRDLDSAGISADGEVQGSCKTNSNNCALASTATKSRPTPATALRPKLSIPELQALSPCLDGPPFSQSYGPKAKLPNSPGEVCWTCSDSVTQIHFFQGDGLCK